MGECGDSRERRRLGIHQLGHVVTGRRGARRSKYFRRCQENKLHEPGWRRRKNLFSEKCEWDVAAGTMHGGLGADGASVDRGRIDSELRAFTCAANAV